MTRWLLTLVLGLALGFTAAADDPKPDAKPTPTKTAPLPAPDYSKYSTIGDVVGTVVKADETSVTFRVTWMVPAGGNSGGRPRLSTNSRNFSNPLTLARMASRNQPKMKEEHHDYVLEYVPESQVRRKSLPDKLDADGKKGFYTPKEQDELKQPYGVPGWRAEKGDLVPGTVVEMVVMRDRTIPQSKATEDDLRIKHVILLGHDPNAPKDAGASKAPPKK